MIERISKDLIGNEAGAIFSDCDQYRYRLWRQWDDFPRLNLLMLNPSKATHAATDPTITRCLIRAQRLGFGGLIVTNLFAYRATFPDDMKRQLDPIGPDNDAEILSVARQENVPMVLCGWGNHGSHLGRAAKVLAMLREHVPDKLHALKINDDGSPTHPLFVSLSDEPFKLTT